MVVAVGFAHALAKLADWKDCDDVSRAIWAARWCAGACDSTTEWTMWPVKRAAGDHDRRTDRRHLDSAGAAKHLRRALTARVGHRGQVLVDPGRKPGNAGDVCERRGRQRQEGRGGRALELAPAHFAAQACGRPSRTGRKRSHGLARVSRRDRSPRRQRRRQSSGSGTRTFCLRLQSRRPRASLSLMLRSAARTSPRGSPRWRAVGTGPIRSSPSP